MRLYSYVVRYDYGFAPNPFHGVCTLATCKPGIRGSAAVGDWVLGTGSADYQLQGKLVYAMRVSETLSFNEYWLNNRFEVKRPYLRGSLVQAFGDNIYHESGGEWIQERSRHSNEDGSLNSKHLKRDLSGRKVLIGYEYVYWGGDGPGVPKRFRDWGGQDLCQQRGYRYRFPDEMVQEVITWIRARRENGCIGDPSEFRSLL